MLLENTADREPRENGRRGCLSLASAEAGEYLPSARECRYSSYVVSTGCGFGNAI